MADLTYPVSCAGLGNLLMAQHCPSSLNICFNLPSAFSALNKFNQRTLLPGEALPLFLHDLKRLLGHTMPELPQEARDQLLLHQFLNGLQPAISKQHRSTGNT